ncbi:dTDP-4-dehydrorhamnose reductase [Zunongwangia sp.]|uniref:dTDP-4-dehydrorhamnose reductase n=1 Tax=Zunongwangia sp. TaxID=1965325 RepID=UPI003AA7FCCA
MKNILITGSNGQLGQSIQKEYQNLLNKEQFNFFFKDSAELDITDTKSVIEDFQKNKYQYCINCAAYTAVDQAEIEKEKALAINAEAVSNLAEVCKANQTILIHISTDFVFSGIKPFPYKETAKTQPAGIYGETKLKGEQIIQQHLSRYFILRTSWLYSEFGNNFLKTMLRLGQEREELSVVFDQVGTPTYARDLAQVILKIIITNSNDFGLYHYSNEGVASWYDFAIAIFEKKNITCNVKSILSEEYPTLAKRPAFSVLDKQKVKAVFSLEIPYWQKSLKNCIDKL